MIDLKKMNRLGRDHKAEKFNAKPFDKKCDVKPFYKPDLHHELWPERILK